MPTIPALTKPILDQRAEFVIGVRPIRTISHFHRRSDFCSGSAARVVRIASHTEVPNATSGFRAMSRTAAQQLMVFSSYTYTLETVIQAGRKNMAMATVPVRVNQELRPSRLVKNIPSYIGHNIVTIVRIFIVYRPFRFFAAIGSVLFAIGFLIDAHLLWHYAMGDGAALSSLILGALLLGMGFQTLLVAFLADLLAANRKLLEEIRSKTVMSKDGSSDLGGIKDD